MYRLLVSVLICLMLVPGCVDSTDVWGFDLDSAQAKLRDGNHEAFMALDFGEIDPSEALRLGAGAAYYLAQIFAERDRNHEAVRLLHQSWGSDPEPWRRRALLMLSDLLLRDESYDELAQLAESGSARYPDDIEVALYRYEALYRMGDYRLLLDELQQLDQRGPRIAGAAGRWQPPLDVALWRAVAAYRERQSDWRERFLAAFTDHRSAEHHSRLFLFARAEGGILDGYDRRESLVIEARYHLADGRSPAAARLFRALINEYASTPHGARMLLAAEVLPDLGRAAVSGGDWRQTASALELLLAEVAERASHEELARIYEYLGRVRRSAGNRGGALAAFERSLELDRIGPDRDRTIWYALQTLSGSDPRAATEFLERYAHGLANPRYFSTVLDGLASQLVQRRDWSSLQRLWRVLDGQVSEGSLAQLGVINAVAIASGLVSADGARVQEYLERAAGQWENPYYALVAAVLLGRGATVLDGPYAAEPAAGPPPASSAAGQEHSFEAYVDGYFGYGLIRGGYLAALTHADSLAPSTLAEHARMIAGSGNFIDSMRLMDLVARRESRVPSQEWARLMYPRPFSPEMGAVIHAERLEPEIFYALVREESYFSAEISSHVGAIGLAQLMPATAAEVARSMRMESPNLTDPATNLAIGGRYLRGLIDRFDSLHDALLGYNAGPTRVRRWRAQHGSLPPLLFQEATPFHETRHYVRKIFVSAVQYGRLYGGVGPDAVFDLLFNVSP